MSAKLSRLMNPKKNKKNSSRFVRFSLKNPRFRRQFVIFLLYYLASLSVFLLVIGFDQFFQRFDLMKYEAGQVAQNDIVAHKDLRFIDEEASRLRQEANARLVNYKYKLNKDISRECMEFYNQFVERFEEYRKEGRGLDNLHLLLQRDFPELFEQQHDFFPLLKKLKSSQFTRLFEVARQMMLLILEQGLFYEDDIIKNDGNIKIDLVRDSVKSISEELEAEKVLTKSKLDNYIQLALMDQNFNSLEIKIISNIVRSFIKENVFFDKDAYEKAVNQARENSRDIIITVAEGEKILKKGYVIDKQDIKKLRALGSTNSVFKPLQISGLALYMLLLLIFSVFLYRQNIFSQKLKSQRLIILIIFYSIFLLCFALFYSLDVFQPFFLLSIFFPVAMLSMLTSILISPLAALYLSLAMALSLVFMGRMTMYDVAFAFFSGAVAAYSVIGADKRLDLARAGLILTPTNIVLVSVIGFLKGFGPSWYLQNSLIAAANALLSGVLTIGLLPVFEHFFNIPTRFRLLEISDLNAPILKRMLTLAPGTYNHSVQVANLAESGCREIGANALLARAGACYHDIGKIDQAEYFTENQKGGNIHDELKPSLSVAVIRSHVKIGIERARELNLPDEVIEIIAQHHGKSVISWFYDKASKEQKSDELNKEDFSYPGPHPLTREAAVVMLADAAEAISRSMDNPNLTQLEKKIWAMIMKKLEEGQLNYCSLTLKDLEILKRSFSHILAGNLHSRIKYPEDKVKEKVK